MSIKKLIEETLKKNPIGVKEALDSILGERVETIVQEEVDEINELSREMLGRYSKKTKAQADYPSKGDKDRSAGRELAGKKRWGGVGGIPAAKVPATESIIVPMNKTKPVTKKPIESSIVKEETLDEISIEKTKDYLKKSNDANRAVGHGYDHTKYPDDSKEHGRAWKRMLSMNKAAEIVRNHENPVRAKVHDLTHMKHDGDVYDHTQTSNKIKDGDVLKLHGKRAGVMVQAWPVITHGDSEILHHAKEGKSVATIDKGRYKKSHEVASELHKKMNEDLEESVRLNPTLNQRDYVKHTNGEKTLADTTVNKVAYALDKIEKKPVTLSKGNFKLESIESLEEISKKTLAAYIEKAIDSKDKEQDKRSFRDAFDHKPSTKVALNREKGVAVADAKLKKSVNEEIIPVEEATDWDSNSKTDREVKHFNIVNGKTGVVSGKAKTKPGARTAVDRHDNKYGAAVHRIVPVWKEDVNEETLSENHFNIRTPEHTDISDHAEKIQASIDAHAKSKGYKIKTRKQSALYHKTYEKDGKEHMEISGWHGDGKYGTLKAIHSVFDHNKPGYQSQVEVEHLHNKKDVKDPITAADVAHSKAGHDKILAYVKANMK